MVYLSKSKYCGLWQCPKIAWLRKYMPEKAVFDSSVLARMEAGNVVGDLAMGLFGDFVEVTAYEGEKLDLVKMIDDTKTEMEKGTENICEASFSYNGLYCAVDILKKQDGGWAIYEVKSSTKHQKDDGTWEDDKEIYIADISYQKYVLEHCGVNVTGTYLVCLNGDYVFDGELDLSKLFYNLAVFMTGQVLHRLRIDAGMDQVCDIGVTQLVRCHIKVDAVDNVFPVDALLSRFRLEGLLDRLPFTYLYRVLSLVLRTLM